MRMKKSQWFTTKLCCDRKAGFGWETPTPAKWEVAAAVQVQGLCSSSGHVWCWGWAGRRDHATVPGCAGVGIVTGAAAGQVQGLCQSAGYVQGRGWAGRWDCATVPGCDGCLACLVCWLSDGVHTSQPTYLNLNTLFILENTTNYYAWVQYCALDLISDIFWRSCSQWHWYWNTYIRPL